ncbi:right-handed parallel beta-helix repeat-containing protein [Myceligenerans pegani]|uniref:Right-handed parallel beta-helix repeat-containing protein n=1 Tax=Myceligenerans pegani TaxID=2776917 RepID=A0ABR9MWT7_9MICO|nr:right-handed parallel beta-helix repeat-containing protein [Myceligenerans sp. TRM 65318]MBE1875864.1 right-handed parallel beta-helix repeat-containing protein [Myceligenerans sp. TRM 65318]MBE3018135.1 right-handed parallel beta-helix repeat-containing protein [Myceligenerans sp. TRM 65318]
MAALSIAAVIVSTLVPGQAATAAPPVKDRTYFATADGAAVGECEAKHACSIERAQELVREEARKGRDVTVQLADGVHRISEPLVFGPQDGGQDGGTVRWTAMPGARPVISGATEISGWSMHDEEAGIYVADTPPGVDSRQLYVNGIIAPRASLRLANSDVTPTPTGLTINNPQLGYLGGLPDQGRIEFESLGDFSDRYSPVESIDGSTITMAQPAWDNNTWGWDTVQHSFLAAPTWFLENSLAFLDEVGEWYLDPSAGKLYYKPGDGVDPDELDVELPRLESLVSIGGTYDEPVTGLVFDGLEFTGTSWLGPSTHGYANQQNGAFVKDDYDYRPADAFTSCSRGCEMFERARGDTWYQEPAAVQISAAHDISVTNNLFTNLGQTALGIGNDANAHLSGVGLGASGIDVVGNIFTEVGGHGIAVGGVLPDAHHPSDPRMTNRDIRIENNTINRVAVEYKDNSGILSTYATNVQIVHNEVANVAYDGIDTGYGWGANDAGGSAEYDRRGYYRWNPRYTTPTTLRDNLVAGNLVHHTKARFADGGNLYNLAASPGTVVERNFVFNVSGVGLYLDEGTRYTTYRHNVLQGTNPWIFTNAYSDGNNTSDNLVQENWYNSGGAQIPNAEQRNNRLIGNVSVSGTNWPQAARDVMCDAGVAPQYRTALNANLFGLAQCPVQAPVGGSYGTTSSANQTYFGQQGAAFGIAAAGADVWGAGGQRDDQYAAVYRAGSFSAGSSVSVRVDTVNDTHAWAKSGVMVRNEIARPGSSAGYAIAAVTPRNGVAFQWDANGDGYLDSSAQASVDIHRPVWVKLDRVGDRVSASWSYDGVNYRRIGSPVTLPGAAAVQDGGVFTTSHDASTAATNVFSGFHLAGPAGSAPR